jgi:hypothetical protein
LNRSRKACWKNRKIFQVIWIKTSNTFWQGTTKKSAKSLNVQTVSLVAGDVTGGGGKATTTKT